MGNSEHNSELSIIFGHCATQKTCTRSTRSLSLLLIITIVIEIIDYVYFNWIHNCCM